MAIRAPNHRLQAGQRWEHLGLVFPAREAWLKMRFSLCLYWREIHWISVVDTVELIINKSFQYLSGYGSLSRRMYHFRTSDQQGYQAA